MLLPWGSMVPMLVGRRRGMLPMLVVLAAASADARRFAVIVRGDAFRSHGEKRNQRLKNVLRCTPEAAAMQEALAAQFRAHVVAPLETAGHVDVFLSGAGCAGDAASSRNAGDAHGDGARARATWDAALAVWYGPVAAAELGARGALQTDKVLRGFDLVAGHERAAGVAYDAVLVTRFDVSHRAPLAAAGLGDLLAATFVEVHGDWFWSAPREAVPVLVAQLRGGCAADAGEDPCANQIFNPTSMCAYSNVLTRDLRPRFENSTRAIDPSKNQPNRLRFDRAREFQSLVGTSQTSG